MVENNNEIIAILNNSELTTVQKYQQLYGQTVSRDKAKYVLNKLRKQLGIELPHKLSNHHKVSINEDRTQWSELVVDCPTDKLKDVDYLLKLHGYEPKEFELVSAQSSLWQAGVKNTKQLYSSKIKVKPIQIENNLVELIDKTIEKYKPQHYNFRNRIKLSGRVLEICLPDLHCGLTEETDSMEQTLEKERERIIQITESVKQYIEANDIDEVHLVFLGDILHYDTNNKTTTHGTQQSSALTFQQMFESTVFNLSILLDHTIKSLEENTSEYYFKIMYVPGNHDTILGYTIMSTLRALFSSKIDFDINQKSRKFSLIGDNLIGYTHGDMNKKRIMQWIYSEAKPYISKAKNIEIHAGHFHSEQTIEDNGIIMRYLSTSAGVSPWEYEQGYNSKRKVEMFLWDKNEGLQSINFINL